MQTIILNNICTRSMKQSYLNDVPRGFLPRKETSPFQQHSQKQLCWGATILLLTMVVISRTSHQNWVTVLKRPPRLSHAPGNSLGITALSLLALKCAVSWSYRGWRGRRDGSKKRNQFILSTTERDFCFLTTCLAALPSSRLLTFLH